MKITIDTKEDSHEDIKKVIELLSNMIKATSGQSVPNNIFESNEMPGVMGMFDTPATPEMPKPAEEPKKDLPRIELY